ncbi:hypothetical protein L7F22_008135 [Adiantum nelumboides]|nr:hypothetical protein [Adiantum nelumboides]
MTHTRHSKEIINSPLRSPLKVYHRRRQHYTPPKSPPPPLPLPRTPSPEPLPLAAPSVETSSSNTMDDELTAILAKVNIKFPSFKGLSSEDVDDHVRRFLALCRTRGLNRLDAFLALFPSTLDSLADKWYSQFGENHFQEWEDLKIAFCSAFRHGLFSVQSHPVEPSASDEELLEWLEATQSLPCFTVTIGAISQSMRTPECIDDEHISEQAEVYSFGLTILEIITRKRSAIEVLSLDKSLPAKIRRLFPDKVKQFVDIGILRTTTESNQVLSLIGIALSCTEEDPALRPSMDSVVSALTWLKKGAIDINQPSLQESQASMDLHGNIATFHTFQQDLVPHKDMFSQDTPISYETSNNYILYS